MSAEQAEGLSNWALVQIDGKSVLEVPEISLLEGKPTWRVAPDFTGTVVTAPRPVGKRFRDFRPALGWERAQFRLTPKLAGRSFPIATMGKFGEGDSVILRIGPHGEARILYDHWAWPLAEFPLPPLALNQDHVLDFFLPVANGPDQGKLRFKVDGRAAVEIPVAVFSSDWRAIAFGRNAVGGSWCEPSFEGATFTPLGPAGE